MLLRHPPKLGIGGDLGLHLGCVHRLQLAIEPRKEFLVVVHDSPTIARSAVRPRTSRLETVPIGSPSISETSRYPNPSTRIIATTPRCSSGRRAIPATTRFSSTLASVTT